MFRAQNSVKEAYFCSRQKINLPGTKVSPHVVRSRRCRCRRRRRRRCRIQM